MNISDVLKENRKKKKIQYNTLTQHKSLQKYNSFSVIKSKINILP